jgi:amino acid transporter
VRLAVLPLDVLGELTSIGTLLAFVLVSLGVLILRRTHPHLKRKFMVPGGPYLVPVLGALVSGLLVSAATLSTIYRLFAWTGLGWIIYAVYGYRRSTLRTMTLPAAASELSGGGGVVETLDCGNFDEWARKCVDTQALLCDSLRSGSC